jgi:iron complex transport system substrate-binding protein
MAPDPKSVATGDATKHGGTKPPRLRGDSVLRRSVAPWHVGGAVAGIVFGLAAVIAAQAPARRIVSLVPAVTEMLFAIGAGPQVIAVSSYDDFPPAVKSLPRVGALLDPDVERILVLRPDLVVSYGTQTDLHSQLERAGIGVFSYRHGGLAGMFETLTTLGIRSGRRAEAEQLGRDLRGHLDSVRARVKGRQRPRTLLVFERDPMTLRGLYVSGGRGFLHEMLDIAGGENVFADVAREAVQPSHETLLARAPDVIVEVRGTAMLAAPGAPDERKAWTALASIPAVRAGRIHLIGGDHMVVPGPRVAQGTEALARALHPEAFK